MIIFNETDLAVKIRTSRLKNTCKKSDKRIELVQFFVNGGYARRDSTENVVQVI